MASVHRNSSSPYWTASVRIWIPHAEHPKGGFWRRSRRSTRILLTEKKSRAKAVAEEMERTENAARDATDIRSFFEQSVSRMLSAAGVVNSRFVTWSQWSQQWLSEQRGSSKTLDKYGSTLARFAAHLGARASDPLRTITHADCTSFYSDTEKSGLSPTTCTQLFKIIRWCLHRAQLHGHIERNPAALVHTDNTSSFVRKAFSVQEIRKIFEHIDNHEWREWRIACLFGLLYGLRLRDALNRKFEEISSEDRMRVIRFVPMKKQRRGKEIVLPLIGELASLNGRGLITPHLSSMSNPSKVFSRILRDTGIKISVLIGTGKGRNQADKSFHSWRHTTNTILSNQGVDVRLRQLISDHESEAMNARYTHPALESMASALVPIASILSRSHSSASASE